MDAEKQILVDSKKTISCQWCGSYESEKWRHDSYRSSVWCSRSCSWAGHLGEFACLTFAMLTIDFYLIALQLGSTQPPYPSAALMFSLLFFVTGLSALAAYAGYSNSKKIPRRGN